MEDIELYKLYLVRAKKCFAENKAFYKNLSKKQPSDLDVVVERIHDEVFDDIDCLKCGLCCKTLGPRFSDTDIQRLAKVTGMKPSLFTEKYLRIDEDNDYVFKTMPCPFIDADNHCAVYADRPKACREYPHTNRKRFYKITPLALQNTLTCPAVYLITEKLKMHY